jgi:hypothetical protein
MKIRSLSYSNVGMSKFLEIGFVQAFQYEHYAGHGLKVSD